MRAFGIGNYICLWDFLYQHDNEIDWDLLQLTARATDMVIIYFQKAASVRQKHSFYPFRILYLYNIFCMQTDWLFLNFNIPLQVGQKKC